MPGPQSKPFGYTQDGRRINGKTAMRHAHVKSWVVSTPKCTAAECSEPAVLIGGSPERLCYGHLYDAA